MALTPGTRLGSYDITAQIGAGGMGEVYRATDSNLKRQVAIKVLPASVAADADRLARFRREAEVLAALNHPNIAGIYGFEKTPECTALVMELVEGEDLSQRIARGAIPIDEALPIAKQIAEALEAAHEQGIIHRDLKPANIKVRTDGTVKVLDFGLAKALEPPGAHAGSQSMAATITTPAMTQAGVILGTAAYMSPEQARGSQLDRRTDLWAFGAVLFELLTGQRAFAGDTVSDTLAAVLKSDPDWRALPGDTPTSIRTLLRRCLEKDGKRRMPDAAAARLEIEDALSGAGAFEEATSRPRLDEAVAAARAEARRAMRVRVALVSVAALAGIAATAGGMWLATRPSPPRVVQTTIATGDGRPTLNGADRGLAITSDGSRLAYAVGNDLLVRGLDTLEPAKVYSGAAIAPHFSPDGQWLSFSDDRTNTLKKVAVAGGPAVNVAGVDGVTRGTVWLPDDTIVFATSAPETGLQRVAAGGGPVTVLTRPDQGKGEADHVWPETLPGGGAVLFTIMATTRNSEDSQIAVLDLGTNTQTVVLRGGSDAHYVASGHLVYVAGGTLWAVAFDPASRKPAGAPVPVLPDVVTTLIAPAGGVQAAVAADGTLFYVRQPGEASLKRTLAWVDRQGRETAIPVPPHAYVYPRISPDGTRIAVDSLDGDRDIWVWDIARTTLTRLTSTPGGDRLPVWSPDGQRLFFSSDRDGARNVYMQAVDGTGTAERLTTSPNSQNTTAVTPDGTRVLFSELAPRTSWDVLQAEVAPRHAVTPLVQTPGLERDGVVSPDGRWLAYVSGESGNQDIFVRPYPDVASGRWQVSTGGGSKPLWSRDGRELFYVLGRGALMRVGVERGASWTATPPATVLAEGAVPSPFGGVFRTYDIAPDGQRFVVLRGQIAAPAELVVIQHFDELLKRTVPGN